MDQYIAIYARVSSAQQDTASQEPDLSRWADAYANGSRVKWFREIMTGTTMARPVWDKLEEAMKLGDVSKLVVWRLDRLGRTASGLTRLFEWLNTASVGLVSVKEGIDLSTPAGRLMANVLASVAAYETEIRAERVLAGQAVARANGKTWGGSERGRRVKVKPEQISTILRLRDENMPIAGIARAVGLTRPTVYSVIRAET